MSCHPTCNQGRACDGSCTRDAAPDREAGYLDYDQPPDPPAGLTGALFWGAWCGFVLLLLAEAFGGAA